MPRAVSVVLADDEERRLDDETEIAMLEWRSVTLSHQEPDQPGVALAHLLRGLVERDPRTVYDGEVGCERAVERDEAVVQHRYDVLG